MSNRLFIRCLKISFLILSSLRIGSSFAQENTTVLKQKADQCFDRQDYICATPAYLQLLSLQPRNAEYNYKYGTCLLFNAVKKQDAIKYLEFATATGQVDLDAFYYMGKAYHLNYQFEEAIKFYNLYKTTAKAKINKAFDVDRQIQMCENGLTLLKNISDIIVLDKKEYSFTEFYRLYDVKGFNGEIIVSAVDQTKLDKKMNHVPVIFFPTNSTRVFFSGYGESAATGKDLYVKKRLPDGSWSKPELLKGEVNTGFDEDFPFMDENGEYLYFSSKGHNSMGGYDIFKSKYDPATQSFGKPVNVDFAISSADDDLFYIVDASGENAWFASSRQSRDGKISVYKVRVERVPTSVIAAKGTFTSVVIPENKKMNVTVKDVNSGKIIGTFYTNKEGDFLIPFPRGGKYEYAIGIYGNSTLFKAVIDIPVSSEFKVIGQQITHKEVSGKELVEVLELKGQYVGEEGDIIHQIARSKAELNPNSEQFDLSAAASGKNNREVLNELGFSVVSISEAANKLQELIQEQLTALQSAGELSQQSLYKITGNTSKITNLQNEAKAIVGKTHQTQNPKEKLDLLVQAENVIAKITNLENENTRLLSFSDSINRQLTGAKELKGQYEKLGNQMTTAVKFGEEQVIAVMTVNEKHIKELNSGKQGFATHQLVGEIQNIQSEIEKKQQLKSSFAKNANVLKADIQSLEARLNTAKQKEKVSLQSQIDSRQNELTLIENEIRLVESGINKLTLQLMARQQQLEFAQTVQKEKIPSKIMTVETAKIAIQTTENQNYKTIKSYIVQQRGELNVQPEYKVQTVSVQKEKTAVINSFVPDFENKITAIENDSTLTEIAKKEKIHAADEALIGKVEVRMELLQFKITQKPDDQQSIEELKNLETIQAEIEDRMIYRAVEIESLKETEANEKVHTTTEILTKLQPELAQKLKQIEQQDLSPIDKTELQQEEDLKFREIVVEAINRQKVILGQNPNDKIFQNELKSLEKLNTEITARIEGRQKKLAQYNDKVHLVSKEEVLETLKPNHAATLEKINNNTVLTPSEKTNALYAEEQILLNAINKEKAIIDAGLKKNPDNSALRSQKESITILQQEVSKSVELLKLQIQQEASIGTNNPEVFKEQPFIEVHNAKMESVQSNASLNSTQKSTQLIQLDKAFRKRIAEEITVVEKTIEKGGSTPELESRLKALQIEKEAGEVKFNEAMQVLVSVEKSRLDPALVLVATDKNYETDQLKIEKDNKADEIDQRIAREQTSQKMLSAQIEKNKLEIKKTGTPVLEAQNQVLSELIEKSQERVNVLKEKTPVTVESEPLSQQKITEGVLSTAGELKTRSEENLADVQLLKQKTGANDPVNSAKINQIISAEKENLEQLKLIQKEKDPSLKTLLTDQVTAKQMGNRAALEEIAYQQQLRQMTETIQVKHPNVTTYDLESLKNLESKRRKASIEIGELSTQLQRIDHELQNAGRKQVKLLAEEKRVTATALESIKNELENIRGAIVYKENKVFSPVNPDAIEIPVSYEEELNISASEQYRKAYESSTILIKLQHEIADKKKELNALNESKHLLHSTGLMDESKKTDASIEENLKRTTTLLEEIEEKEKRAFALKEQIKADLDNSENGMKVQNLLIRGVSPITKLAVAASFMPLPVKGFEIVAHPETVKKVEIPVDINVPSGLVYRVQVGAFAKPVKNELFKEFTPVTGEKLQSGITRYMAGYFTSRTAVLGAKDQIRNIGYSDAFPVAYCDGKRISMYEAQRLEENRLCVAKGIDELMMSVSEDIHAQNPGSTMLNPAAATVRTTIPDPVRTYYQAQNAAPAIPVENKPGLFYTVQIGVYNRPVEKEQVRNIEPLITKRLANGQIRYCAGIFRSAEEAKPKRKEAIAKGITDAFITAYYKGERITLDEAKRLYALEGDKIIEKLDASENKILSEAQISKLEVSTKMKELKESATVKKAPETIQFVSKKTFEHFPMDVLKRYNQRGDFYYDVSDKKVKSVYYTLEDAPQVFSFKGDIDTVVITNATMKSVQKYETLKAVYNAEAISGEIGDWLLRFGYPKEMLREEDKIKLIVSAIANQADYDYIASELSAFGFIILKEE